MRTTLSAAVFFLALSGTLAAGDFFHPDSNPAQGGTLALPWSTNETRYQALIPASVFSGKKVRIVEVAFAPSAAGTFTSTQCEIRMAHMTTTRLTTQFDTNLQKDRTVVFSGKISWTAVANQWSNIGLTSFFNYNGTDNVVLEVRHMGGRTAMKCRTGNVVTVFITGSGAYSSPTAGMLGVLLAPKMRFTYDETVLSGSGAPTPGGTVDLDLRSTPDPGLPFQLGSSFSDGPIPIDTRKLYLGLDDLLVISVNGWAPQIFDNYAGFLDASGKAKAKILIPAWAFLKGIKIHTAFVTVKAGAPSSIANISNTFMFPIT